MQSTADAIVKARKYRQAFDEDIAYLINIDGDNIQMLCQNGLVLNMNMPFLGPELIIHYLVKPGYAGIYAGTKGFVIKTDAVVDSLIDNSDIFVKFDNNEEGLIPEACAEFMEVYIKKVL